MKKTEQTWVGEDLGVQKKQNEYLFCFLFLRFVIVSQLSSPTCCVHNFFQFIIVRSNTLRRYIALVDTHPILSPQYAKMENYSQLIKIIWELSIVCGFPKSQFFFLELKLTGNCVWCSQSFQMVMNIIGEFSIMKFGFRACLMLKQLNSKYNLD